MEDRQLLVETVCSKVLLRLLDRIFLKILIIGLENRFKIGGIQPGCGARGL